MFTIFTISLFLTMALVPLLTKLALKMNIVDLPDSRKVHINPMPKTGGLSMAIGAFIPLFFWLPKNDFIIAVFTGAFIILAFGFMDDIRPMNFVQKIIPQVFAALFVIFVGGVKIKCLGITGQNDFILAEPVSIFLTLFVIVGVTNAINLSDGLDGLAGGISMLSFVVIAFLAYRSGNSSIAFMSISVVAAIIGFLRYNTHPAVLFMGDAGSQLLGFLLVVFLLSITQANTPYSRVLALPLIGFPILDTLTVMIERIMAGHSPFKADKNHFHHRLLKFGFSHSRAVLIIYIIQACFLSTAFILRFYPGWIHIVLFFLFWAAIQGSFLFAGHKNYSFKKKEWVATLKSRKILIKLSFFNLKYGFFLLLFFQCITLGQISLYFSMVCFLLICLIIGIHFFKPEYQNAVLRFALCMVIPAVFYFSRVNQRTWFENSWWPDFNTVLYFLLVLFVITTLRLTKRKKGFKVTGMEILIFIVILIFPNLPTVNIQFFGAGAAIAKVMVLFFTLDVLLGELRLESKEIEKPSIIILSFLVLKGFFG